MINTISKRMSIISSAIALMVSLSIPTAAFASVVTFSSDTTVTVGSFTLTILSGSTAASVEVGTSTVIVTTGAGDSLTITSAAQNQLNTTPEATFTCAPSLSTVVIAASKTVTVTPTSTTCTLPSSGGGGGGSVSSPVTNPIATATPETLKIESKTTQPDPATLPYAQLPEKSSKKSKTINDKDVKFPSSGKVTEKTLMKNTQNGSSLLLTFGSKVTTAGKPFTGTISGPKDILPANLPSQKFPKGGTFLKAVEVKYSENVKVNGKFQLNVSLPSGTKANKSKDKKRFQLYLWTNKGWVRLGDAALSANGMSVYTKTPKYGVFILMDTAPQKKAQ